MDATPDRLDEAMDARRLDLDLEWKDVAEIAKISPAALRAIRRAKTRPSALTRRRLEDALQWEHGSIQSILDGREPTTKAVRATEAYEPERQPTLAEVAAELRELREEVKELRQRDRGQRDAG